MVYGAGAGMVGPTTGGQNFMNPGKTLTPAGWQSVGAGAGVGGGFSSAPRPGSWSGGIDKNGSTVPGSPTSGSTSVQSKFKPYKPVGASPGVAGTAGTMQRTGAGMMTPGSKLYQDMLSRFKQDIGGQAAAQQRAAALTGAESGMGAGANPEAMQMQAMAGAAGTEATGRATTNFGIAAPQAGAQIAGAGAGLSLEEQRRKAQEAQFGSSMSESGRQFDVNSGFDATRIAQNQQQMNNDAMMRMYGMAFGGM